MSPNEEAYKGAETARLARHRQNAMSSRLLLLRMQKFHFDVAPHSYKSRFLPSPIVGNALALSYKRCVESGVKEVVKRSIPVINAKPGAASFAMILIAVSKYYGVSVEELSSPSRKSRLIGPRHVAFYLLERMTTMSINGIGRKLNRDHTVVIFAVGKVKKGMAADPAFALQVETIRQQIMAMGNMPTDEMIRQAKAKHRSNRSTWTPLRDAALIRMVGEGKNFSRIAHALKNISPVAVKGRYGTLMRHAAQMESAS
jgi:hypothetical protein